MDKREEIGQEWLKTLLRGKKLAKRDEIQEIREYTIAELCGEDEE